jgi:hypothetical protein
MHNRLVGQYNYHETLFEMPTDRPMKILQIADIQLPSLSASCVDYTGECDAWQSIRFIEKLVAKDTPDLVVFGGDNVVGKHGDAMARQVIQHILQPVKAASIPFVAIMGNHDVEQYDMSVSKMLDLFRDEGAVFSGNGVLHMHGRNGIVCDAYFFNYMYNMNILWGFYRFIPTHWLTSVGMPTGNSRYGIMNGVTRDQRDWFEFETVGQRTRSIVVFGHVPLPEYKYLASTSLTGSKHEDVDSFADNRESSVFFEALTSAGVDVVSVGHDHINDFCGRHASGPYLCYAGGAGYTTYGLIDWPRRVRYFVIDHVGHISTYKILDDKHLSTIDLQNISAIH